MPTFAFETIHLTNLIVRKTADIDKMQVAMTESEFFFWRKYLDHIPSERISKHSVSSQFRYTCDWLIICDYHATTVVLMLFIQNTMIPLSIRRDKEMTNIIFESDVCVRTLPSYIPYS